jgi:hypothetical protein
MTTTTTDNVRCNRCGKLQLTDADEQAMAEAHEADAEFDAGEFGGGSGFEEERLRYCTCCAECGVDLYATPQHNVSCSLHCTTCDDHGCPDCMFDCPTCEDRGCSECCGVDDPAREGR